MSCALSSRRNLSSPTLESKENPYLAHAVEKYHKTGKNHGNLKPRKDVINFKRSQRSLILVPGAVQRRNWKQGSWSFERAPPSWWEKKLNWCSGWPWTPSDPGIGHVALYFALSSTLESKENPYFAPEVAKQSPWPFEISSWKDTELELIEDPAL